jgi:hypothetical protein
MLSGIMYHNPTPLIFGLFIKLSNCTQDRQTKNKGRQTFMPQESSEPKISMFVREKTFHASDGEATEFGCDGDYLSLSMEVSTTREATRR